MKISQRFACACNVTLLVLVTVTACGSPDSRTLSEGDAPDPSAAMRDANDTDGATGSLTFALTAGGSIELSSFGYAISRGDYHRSGQVDVSNSTKISAEIAGIPVATGYSVTLSGTSTSTPTAQCQGSATFDIAARTQTDVPVTVDCHLADVAVAPPSSVPAPIPPFAPGLLAVALLGLGALGSKKKQTK